MKQSIYLTENVMRIVMDKLNREGLQYETEMQKNGGMLFVEEKDIPRCSVLVENARKEEKELLAAIHTITCEVVNTEKLDVNEIPNEPIIGNLAIVPIRANSEIVNTDYCWSIFRSPDEVIEESVKRLKSENFVIEKLSALLKDIMEKQGFADDYIEETLNFYNGKTCPVWVLHNYPKKNGTAALCKTDLLKVIYDNLEESFYILPTSRQECLIIPESEVNSLSALQEFYKALNEDELRLDEALSEQILYFNSVNLMEAIELPERPGVDISACEGLCSAFLRLREV